jgi:hypothetical protein
MFVVGSDFLGLLVFELTGDQVAYICLLQV